MKRRYRIVIGILMIPPLLLGIGMLVLAHDSACKAPPARSDAATSMRAMVYRCYGSPDRVKLEQVDKPTPAPGHVLVKVIAASVNPYDWHFLKGEPYVMRAMSGVGAPTDIRLGADFAGTIEALGEGVTRFKVGDPIFGGAAGAFSDYVSVRESGSIAIKPASITFEQAAAVPIAAVTALQALRDSAELKPGQKVLINGASGGVGTYAVQIAKVLGAEVTGVASTRNLDMVRKLGADHAIDYTRVDFAALPDRYDVVLDIVGNHSRLEYRKVLNPAGRVIIVGGVDCGVCLGALLSWAGSVVIGPLVGKQQQSHMLASLDSSDLRTLAAWLEEGKITSIIDRRYGLSEVPAALAYLELGHARGKVVVDVQPGAAAP